MVWLELELKVARRYLLNSFAIAFLNTNAIQIYLCVLPVNDHGINTEGNIVSHTI